MSLHKGIRVMVDGTRLTIFDDTVTIGQLKAEIDYKDQLTRVRKVMEERYPNQAVLNREQVLYELGLNNQQISTLNRLIHGENTCSYDIFPVANLCELIAGDSLDQLG